MPTKLPRFAAVLAALLLLALVPAAATTATATTAGAAAKATAKPGVAPAQKGPAIRPVVPPKTLGALSPDTALRPAPAAAPLDLNPQGRTVQPADTRNQAFWSWGVTEYQSGLNCSIIEAPYYETQVTSQVGYGGTATVPKVGERFNVVLLYSHPGYACSGGFAADVYSELELPEGAALAIDQNHGIQCFTNTRANPDTYVDVTNSTWTMPSTGAKLRWCDTDGGPGKYGAIGLGMRLMVTGTIFQIVVPVVATKELKGAAHVPTTARFLSVTESVVTTGLAFPDVWANVLGFFPGEITYPVPSATEITQTTAKTRSIVSTHYKGGNAYIDFGETTAYGTSTDAIPLPAGADWYSLDTQWGELTPGRTYHWRARFVGSDGAVTNGPDQTFTTAADTQAPDTTLATSGPSGQTESRTATFAFTSPETGSTFECKLDAGPWAACASPKAYSGLAVGGHTFAVRAKDAAGNADATPAIRTWTITAPPAPSWVRPSGLGGTRAGAAVRGDFNGDGRSDLAVGVPGENGGAGAVQVFNGSTTGLTATGSKLIDQSTPYVSDDPERGDGFGSSLVAGDFNGDGKADLAVGVPGEDVGTIGDAGAVHVLLGRSTGLSGTGSQMFTQNSVNVADAAETGDRFGSALAAGDFGGDGKADLAVGVPAEGLGTATGAGVVHVLPGAAAGLTAGGSQYWSQDTTDVADSSQAGDGFGASLSAANVAGGTQDDLVVGVPAEDAGTTLDTGMLHVLPGSAANLTAAGSQALSQDSSGIADSGEAGDGFASALAAGDFTGDGRADVAVGTPAEDLGALADAGVVQVLPGSPTGLTGTGSQYWYQNTGGVADDAEAGDRFGSALVAGNLGGDAKADLAVGAPGEDLGTVADAGVVHALLGAAGGLTATGSRYYNQDSAGIVDTAEAGDRFGASLTAADVGGTALDDLAVGVPAEDLGAIADAGVVQVLPGSATGPTATGSQIWGQGSTGVAEDAEAGDGFGSALGR